MSTFVQLQDKIMNHFGTSDQEIRDEVKEAINDIIAEINDEVPQAPHLETADNVTLTANSTTVTGVPSATFDHILSLQIAVDGKNKPPLTFLSRERWFQERLFDESAGEPTHYSVFDGQLYVAPKPDSAYTGTIEYYQFDTALSDTTDTSKLTDHYARWERVIVEGVKSKIHEYLATDGQMIQVANQKYQHGIRRFRNWVRRNFNKSPNASRVRGWRETLDDNPRIPRELIY